MSKTQKRRATKTGPSHQNVKRASESKSNVNWLRIAAIAVGLIIVISMLLSTFIVPGTSGGGF